MNLKIIKTLDPRLRTALVTAIVVRSLSRYSAYCQKTFNLKKGFDVAWTYALTGKDNAPARQKLIENLGVLIERAEKEWYGNSNQLAVISLLEGIDNKNLKANLAAIEWAAGSFVLRQFYARGLSNLSKHKDVTDKQEKQFFKFVNDAFKAALVVKKPVDRKFLNSIKLDDTFPEVKVKDNPKSIPIHERK